MLIEYNIIYICISMQWMLLLTLYSSLVMVVIPHFVLSHCQMHSLIFEWISNWILDLEISTNFLFSLFFHKYIYIFCYLLYIVRHLVMVFIDAITEYEEKKIRFLVWKKHHKTKKKQTILFEFICLFLFIFWCFILSFAIFFILWVKLHSKILDSVTNCYEQICCWHFKKHLSSFRYICMNTWKSWA